MNTQTPRTDAVADCTWQEGEVVDADFARQLERELNELKTAWQEQTIERQKIEKERDKQISVTIGQMETITRLHKSLQHYEAQMPDATGPSVIEEERDQLRAEVERLSNYYKGFGCDTTINELRAELDEAKSNLNTMYDKEVLPLRAEVDRLQTQITIAREMDIQNRMAFEQWREVANQLAAAGNELLNHGTTIPHHITGNPMPLEANPQNMVDALAAYERLKGETKC